ncbi:phosphatase PAP2 family protein [Metabacillus litoralis]|uniref:phosphatase PAP2 family protein n=1 Tax=Metabacillus litoralis TaxID=152268 RepID=UPI000EF62505|nr:phosphatase PAP2 family protein [Metabacillus litoralis]
MKTKNIVILLTVLFIGLIALVMLNATNKFETIIGETLYSFHDHRLATIFEAIGMLGSTIGIIVTLFIFMIVFAIVEKGFITSSLLFVAVLFGNFLNKALKAVIGRERPTFPQHIEDGYSFPSGHVMVGLLLFGTIAYKLLKKTNDQKMKQTILVCTSLIVVVIGMSRLLEGEHFLTDVIGGMIAGSLLLIGIIHLDVYLHKIISRRKVKSDLSI